MDSVGEPPTPDASAKRGERGSLKRIAYDLIGSRETGAVAIVEVPEGVDPAEAAREVSSRHRHVKSVLIKRGPREGEERLRRYEVVWGDENTEVIHKEHGYRLRLDPRRVYFSPREATDRMEVASMVRPGERVLVMFAGVGPYAVAIARTQPEVREVVGVEINPDAVRYFEENIRLNRLEGKVRAILGDVREVCPSMFGEFDRVVMPLPKGAYMFLDLALRCLRPEGGVIHFYYWGGEDAPERAAALIEGAASQIGLEARVLGWRRVGSYSPRKWKFRIDVEVRPRRRGGGNPSL